MVAFDVADLGERREYGMARAERLSSTWERHAWVAGILFVIALVAEGAVAIGVGVNQDDSAAKIANALRDHQQRLHLIAYLSVICAAMFVVYLNGLYNLLRADTGRARVVSALVLIGGTLLVALHGVSDIGITGLLGAKLATFGAQQDQGVSYTLYLLVFAFESVGDVFGSVFAIATGVLVMSSRLLPRWLGWVAIAFGVLFFIQGFGLGGVIATFGLVVDGIGFVLFLIFVLASSVIMLTRGSAVPASGQQPAR